MLAKGECKGEGLKAKRGGLGGFRKVKGGGGGGREIG